MVGGGKQVEPADPDSWFTWKMSVSKNGEVLFLLQSPAIAEDCYILVVLFFLFFKFFLWSPYVIGQTIYIFMLWFVLLYGRPM